MQSWPRRTLFYKYIPIGSCVSSCESTRRVERESERILFLFLMSKRKTSSSGAKKNKIYINVFISIKKITRAQPFSGFPVGTRCRGAAGNSKDPHKFGSSFHCGRNHVVVEGLPTDLSASDLTNSLISDIHVRRDDDDTAAILFLF